MNEAGEISGTIDPTLHVTVIANDIKQAADEPFLFGMELLECFAMRGRM